MAGPRTHVEPNQRIPVNSREMAWMLTVSGSSGVGRLKQRFSTLSRLTGNLGNLVRGPPIKAVRSQSGLEENKFRIYPAKFPDDFLVI